MVATFPFEKLRFFWKRSVDFRKTCFLKMYLRSRWVTRVCMILPPFTGTKRVVLTLIHPNPPQNCDSPSSSFMDWGGPGQCFFQQIWVNVRYGEVAYALRVLQILPLFNLPSFPQFCRRSVPFEKIAAKDWVALHTKSPYTTGNVTGNSRYHYMHNYSTKLRIWARRRRKFLRIRVSTYIHEKTPPCFKRGNNKGGGFSHLQISKN